MKKIFLVLLTVLLLTGCNSSIENNDNDNNQKEKEEIKEVEIVNFKYAYGSPMGLYYDYEIYYEDNTILYKKYFYNGKDETIVKEADKSVLKEIDKIIKENEIDKWDGFNKSKDNVLDGSGFTLSVTYNNGTSIKAHGYMKYPTKYKEKIKPLIDYLNKLGEYN